MKCLRCNRKLRSEKSIKVGYGQLCLKKHKKERLRGYFKDNGKTEIRRNI